MWLPDMSFCQVKNLFLTRKGLRLGEENQTTFGGTKKLFLFFLFFQPLRLFFVNCQAIWVSLPIQEGDVKSLNWQEYCRPWTWCPQVRCQSRAIATWLMRRLLGGCLVDMWLIDSEREGRNEEWWFPNHWCCCCCWRWKWQWQKKIWWLETTVKEDYYKKGFLPQHSFGAFWSD